MASSSRRAPEASPDDGAAPRVRVRLEIGETPRPAGHSLVLEKRDLRLGPSSVLQRARDFLPMLESANRDLAERAAAGEDVRIDRVPASSSAAAPPQLVQVDLYVPAEVAASAGDTGLDAASSSGSDDDHDKDDDDDHHDDDDDDAPMASTATAPPLVVELSSEPEQR